MAVGETDTTMAVDALFHRQLMQRSGIERLRMACDMFDAATTLIIAGLPPDVVGLPTERRIAVLQRLYWPERNETMIRSAIAAAAPRARAPGPIARGEPVRESSASGAAVRR